jgi:hypothetical protein
MQSPKDPAVRLQKIAIAVMSFDRPRYLERVLQTVVAQDPFETAGAVFYLFQDGSISPRTAKTYGKRDQMDVSVTTFRDYLPGGHVFQAEINLGVAMNFDRAERVLFEENDYEAAIFLEDDLILQPSYFRIMEDLLNRVRDREDIGMVSARGYRNDTPLPDQRFRAREVRLMDEHNWAFGMTRRAWQARDRVMRPYLDIVGGIDYRERDQGERKVALKMLQQSLGRHGHGYLTSQDSMKNMAFEILGLNRITTYINNARYIGKEGEHSNADKFAQRGYHRTVLYDRPYEGVDLPDPDSLRRMRLGLQYR